MIEGNFIVLEGVDGAGTTTHTKDLGDYFRGRGLPVHTTREPSDGPIGVLVRQMIQGRVVVPGIHGTRAPHWTTMALMFAADRVDHVDAEIRPNLMDGVNVICDRYDYSSVAYQSIRSGESEEAIPWLKRINSHALRPDLTVVLDVPAEVAAERRRQRSGVKELYDDAEFQEKLTDFYATMENRFESENIVHVNGNRPRKEVALEIQKHIRSLRKEL